MENRASSSSQILMLALGEAIVSALVCAAYLVIGKFDYTVLTGVALGSVVTVANFVFLTLSVNRSLDRKGNTRGDVGLDQTRDDVHRGALSTDD